jgi:GNAT superfamily N-acetyltransferase
MTQLDSIRIRPITPADIPALTRFMRDTTMASFAPFLGEEAVSTYLDSGNADRYLEARIDSGWALFDRDVLAGLALTEDMQIGQLMIDHRRHRRGLGTRLLAHVEQQLFATHALLELQSFEANTVANAFYRAQGWQEAERRLDAETGIPMIVFRKGR